MRKMFKELYPIKIPTQPYRASLLVFSQFFQAVAVIANALQLYTLRYELSGTLAGILELVTLVMLVQKYLYSIFYLLPRLSVLLNRYITAIVASCYRSFSILALTRIICALALMMPPICSTAPFWAGVFAIEASITVPVLERKSLITCAYIASLSLLITFSITLNYVLRREKKYFNALRMLTAVLSGR